MSIYAAVHMRLRRTFGPASSHACVDCGGRAAEWSYNHDDMSSEWVNDLGSSACSPDMAHYRPRCKPCHGTLDREHARNRPPLMERIRRSNETKDA